MYFNLKLMIPYVIIIIFFFLRLPQATKNIIREKEHELSRLEKVNNLHCFNENFLNNFILFIL